VRRRTLLTLGVAVEFRRGGGCAPKSEATGNPQAKLAFVAEIICFCNYHFCQNRDLAYFNEKN